MHICGERPLLGSLLLEQGAMREDDLELALRAQAQNGERLGEILVELELLSRPALDRAVASQSGIELAEERGYGTGLRAELERRHRFRRGLPAEAADHLEGAP
jgi:hypothetical protein